MKIKLMFAWYDFWVGLFWDSKKKCLYIFPIPTLGLKIEFTQQPKTIIDRSHEIQINDGMDD